MAGPSAPPEDGDHIVDSNGVVWLVRSNTDRALARWEARVDRDSVRAYDTPDEDPVIFLQKLVPPGVTPTTTKDLTDAINVFAVGNKQNILLRVRETPDKPNIGALVLLVLALLVLDSKR